MVQLVQCVYCGEFTQIVAPAVYAGSYQCPECKDLGLFVPETELTPRCEDALDVFDYEVLRSRIIFRADHVQLADL
jgi:hypothetical protein